MTDDPDAAVDPAARRARDLASVAAAWVTSEPVLTLLDTVAVREPNADRTHLDESLPDWIAAAHRAGTVPAGLGVADWDRLRGVLEVERRAAERFNFRRRRGKRYVERFESKQVKFPAHLRDVIVAETTRLGLVEPESPRRERYDRTLVLGGGFVSPLFRARYAASLAERGIDLGHLYFLGSPRPLLTDPKPRWRRWRRSRAEHHKTDAYAPGAVDEFDLMTAAATSAFPLRPGPTTFLCGCTDGSVACPEWPGGDSGDFPGMPVTFTHERARELLAGDDSKQGAVLSASTSRPPIRPDTSDTYGLWSRYAHPQDDTRLLVVTTQIFVPFQRFDALRRLALDRDIDIEVVGYGAEWNDRPLTPQNLLQETLSGIRSARRLVVAATDRGRTLG